MNPPQVLTLLVLLGVVALLMLASFGADAVLLAGVLVLLLGGVLDPAQALQGFANEGVLTIAALFVVAAGVRQTGAMGRLATLLLGRSAHVRIALARLTLPVAALSALMNNTPIVAALVPAVGQWTKSRQLPASKFLIPLSYATILGGTISLIGTSTNLVVAGLIEQNLATTPGLSRLGLFDIAPVGIPVALVGCLLLILAGPRFLPERKKAVGRDADPRLYTTEFLVLEGGPLVGKSIEQAGLRHLSGAFLAELGRDGVILPAVEPSTLLSGRDRLVFVGPKDAVVDLGQLPGLSPAPDQTFKLDAPVHERRFVEVVVAPNNPLCGQTIREGRFRSHFQAVVIAVARDGERVEGRIGDVVLAAGDVLLLECAATWLENPRNRRAFFITSEIPDASRLRHERAWLALSILAVMVLCAALELTTMFIAASTAAAAMILTGCLSGPEARRSLDLPVLVAIAAAFGLSAAVRASGLDSVIAHVLASVGPESPRLSLVALYLTTAVLTELLTNNAAAALMFPFSLSLAAELGKSPLPFCVTIMFAASASFATPLGYQTNLMVYGPGGYRFSDFLRLGIPLQITTAVITCVLVPIVFPL